MSCFHPFGCQCFILNAKDNLGMFDFKCDNGILLGYSKTSKAYREYISRTLVLEESIHVKFNDAKPDRKISELDEFIADLRLDDGIGPLTTTNQPIEAYVSNQTLNNLNKSGKQLDEYLERII